MADAVTSVLQQTVNDFELLVVDDGSIDQTPLILAGFAERDARIRLFRHATPQGAPAARNTAIMSARGEFITGLDDDDLMLPNRLQSFVTEWTEKDSFLCSAFWLEKSLRRKKMNARSRPITLTDLLYRNLVGNQVFTLTERIRAVGGFDQTLVASQDYDLWVRLIDRFGVGRRIAAAEYIVRENDRHLRISASPDAYDGAVQFTDKHKDRMTASHLKSQALVQTIAARRNLSLRDRKRYLTWSSADLFFKYWLKCQLSEKL